MHDSTATGTDLDRLESEGLVSFEQVEEIRGADRRADPWPGRRVVEALAYVGTAAFVVAAFIWFGDISSDWRDPNHWGAFGIALAAAVVLAAAGYLLIEHRGGIRRASGLMLAVTVLFFALATAQFFEGVDFTGEWAALVNSLLIAAAAAGAWWLRKSVPTELALFAAASGVITAVIGLIQEASFNPTAFDAYSISGTAAGILLWLLGAVWIRLGYRGVLRSANTAYLLGGTTMLVSSAGLMLGVNRWWIVLLVVTALGTALSGVYLRRTMLMVIAVVGILLAPYLGLASWLGEPPSTSVWIMMYGIPGVLLIGAALVWAERMASEG